jgi:hypothetical protein
MAEGWPPVTAEAGHVDYVEVDAGGVPVMRITPEGAAEDRVILSIHSASFVVGPVHTPAGYSGTSPNIEFKATVARVCAEVRERFEAFNRRFLFEVEVVVRC